MPQQELLDSMEQYSTVTLIILLISCLISQVLWLYLVMLAAFPRSGTLQEFSCTGLTTHLLPFLAKSVNHSVQVCISAYPDGHMKVLM